MASWIFIQRINEIMTKWTGILRISTHKDSKKLSLYLSEVCANFFEFWNIEWIFVAFNRNQKKKPCCSGRFRPISHASWTGSPWHAIGQKADLGPGRPAQPSAAVGLAGPAGARTARGHHAWGGCSSVAAIGEPANKVQQHHWLGHQQTSASASGNMNGIGAHRNGRSVARRWRRVSAVAFIGGEHSAVVSGTEEWFLRPREEEPSVREGPILKKRITRVLLIGLEDGGCVLVKFDEGGVGLQC
jgi:hypothetical protein